MKLLFYCGHPAQYLFFRETIRRLNNKGHQSLILIKTKDVLEELVKSDGFDYLNILPRERKNSKMAIGLSLIKRNLKLLPIILKEKPDVLIGGDPSISQIGWLLRKRRFTLTEDDYPVIKTLARLTFPFAETIVTPEVNNVGKWEHKKTGYKGYMKLAYLHPNVFKPEEEVLSKYKISGKYALIRRARLTAHHDFGIKGLNDELLDEIIRVLQENNITPYLSSESSIPEKHTAFQLNIEPADMHHILAFSNILISDSQSMSVEAAMLGVPSIRYSSFAGRISVLEELEKTYRLTFGIKEGKSKQLIEKLNELLQIGNLRPEFQARRQKMLSEKINVTAFLVWFIENYPDSIKIVKENPGIQEKFK
jgi:uncharacterized protein